MGLTPRVGIPAEHADRDNPSTLTASVHNHPEQRSRQSRGCGCGPSEGPLATSGPPRDVCRNYGAIYAAWLLIASKEFFASSCVVFTWPYQALPPTFDWPAA